LCLYSGGSKDHGSKEECYQSLTKEGYYVPGSDPVPKVDLGPRRQKQFCQTHMRHPSQACT